MDNDTPLKRCSKCGEEFPATPKFFTRSKDGKFGLCSQCKNCRYADTAIWRKTNKEHLRQYDTARRPHKPRRGRNPEAKKTTQRRYREKHREEIRKKARERYAANIEKEHERSKIKRQDPAYKVHRQSYSKKYRENNAERQKQLEREWRKNNPHKLVASSQRRRARERGAEGHYSAEDILRKYSEQNGKCYWCGKKVGKTYHVDHIIPLSRGGSNWPDNICISCPTCNDSRGAKLPQEWGRLF